MPQKSIEVTDNDFYNMNILIKEASSTCKHTDPSYEIVLFKFILFEINKKDPQTYNIIYRSHGSNTNADLYYVVSMIPTSFPTEIIWVKRCCKKHFENKTIIIQDVKEEKDIEIVF